MDIFISILIVFFVFCIYMLFRNNAVYNYRMEILRKVSIVNQREIANLDLSKWRDRINRLDSVSYDEMMRKF